MQVQEREGVSNQQVARRCSIGVATVHRWCHRLQPKKYTLTRPRKIDLEKLAQDVKDFPDDYPFERAARCGVKQVSICHALRRLGITSKKTRQHPKADDEQRLRFQTRVQKYRDEGCEISDVDESGFAKDMPRCRGYSIRGKHCYGKQEWQAKGRTHVMGALLNNT